MRVDIITPFPELVRGFFNESIIKRARDKGLVIIELWDLRKFATGKHKKVDDYPYGGGPGMIMKPEPIFRAVERIREIDENDSCRVILMTPQGERYTQEKAERLAEEAHLVFICGHYRGVDERVIEALVDEEISIGDYILTGGELAAAVVVDSVVRLIPGVLGNFDSAEGDSFSCGKLDYPHYTRPEVYRGMKVPDVLLSGNHAEIDRWREQQAVERTLKKRSDLIQRSKDKE